jgi:CubicO group peptidase (beta-lactamase class C family)
MPNNAQTVPPNNSRSDKLSFLAAALGIFTIAAAICSGATPPQDTTEPIWPTKAWQTSSPEEQGMDSKELANLVDFGTTHSFDSLLVARHGRIVAEAYYAPYAADIPHTINSCTKSIIGTLTAIAFKEGLLDSPSHRVLDFFDRREIANLDERKEAITVQNLLDMTSGLEWIEPPYGTQPSAIEMSRSPDWVKFILDRRMSSAPGDTFQYNSGSAHLVSAILTKLTGKSAMEYAEAKLFGPLGINDVYWAHDPQGISIGGADCGCVLATWRRLATYTYARACGKGSNCFRLLGSIR